MKISNKKIIIENLSELDVTIQTSWIEIDMDKETMTPHLHRSVYVNDKAGIEVLREEQPLNIVAPVLLFWETKE